MSSPLSIERIEAVLVSHSPDAIATRDQLIAEAEFITSIDSPSDGEMAVEALKNMKGLLKLAEASRVEVKKPVLEVGKRIDSLASEFCAPLVAAAARVNDMIAKWQLAQQKAAQEAERLRRAELDRIEKERQAKLREEEDRLAALKKAEQDKARAELEARLAITRQEQAEALAKVKAAELERREQFSALHETKAEQRELVAQASVMAPVPVAKPAGVVNKTVWRFEVGNLQQLLGARADLCDISPSSSRINEAIRNGMKECPGLRIWSEQQTTVRT